MKRLLLSLAIIIGGFLNVYSQGYDMLNSITMDDQEKDKILSCVELVSKKFSTDQVFFF